MRPVQRFLAEYRDAGLDRVRLLDWRGKPNELAPPREWFVGGPFLGCLWCLVRLVVPGPSGRKRYDVLGQSTP